MSFFSALNKLAGGVAADVMGNGNTDNVVGTDIDVTNNVDHTNFRVHVDRRIGEGGFAFVYAVTHVNTQTPAQLALKRLLAADQEKREAIHQEIKFLRELRPCESILRFVAFGHLKNNEGLSSSKCEEFLLLTELCSTSLFHLLADRTQAYPPITVARIMSQVLNAVSYMHKHRPPIAHRDLKAENVLVSATDNRLKLCDFGSATTNFYYPKPDWSMAQRTEMQEALNKCTTPNYRSPEMIDCWSNYPINQSADIWALGCFLFQLCVHRHPFEDGGILSITNGNYNIPGSNSSHGMFHTIIKRMLVVIPEQRANAVEVTELLSAVAQDRQWSLKSDIDFEVNLSTANAASAVNSEQHGPESKEEAQVSSQQQSPSSHHQNQYANQIMSSFNKLSMGNAGNMLRNLKEGSKAAMHNWLSKDLDLHLLTTRIAAMGFPVEGMEIAFNKSNANCSAEEIRNILEKRHPNKYAVVNLCERKYPNARFPSGKVIDAEWTSVATPSLSQLIETSLQCFKYLASNSSHVLCLHCLDGKSNTALLFVAMMIMAGLIDDVDQGAKYFETKRCEPVWSIGQRTVLKQLRQLLKNNIATMRDEVIKIQRESLVITSVIMEPIPLFTKANDGVRPLLDIHSEGGRKVDSSFESFSSLQLFTPYDGEAMIKLKLSVSGECSIILFHARQSFFGGKLDKLPICRVHLDPAIVPPNRTYMRFATHQLDFLAGVDKVPADFSVTVNFQRKHKFVSTKIMNPIANVKRSLESLLFGSAEELRESVFSFGLNKVGKADNESIQNMENAYRESKTEGSTLPEAKSTSASPTQMPPDILDLDGRHPVVPEPRTEPPMTKPASLIDIVGLTSNEPPINSQLNNNNRQSSLNNINSEKDDATLINLGHHPPANELFNVNFDHFNDGDDKNRSHVGTSTKAFNANHDILLDFNHVPEPTIGSSFSNDSVPQMKSATVDDIFGARNEPSKHNTPQLQPTIAPSNQPSSQSLLEDVLNKLDDVSVNKNTVNTDIPKPNYSSSSGLFSTAPSSSNAPSKSGSTADFGDLLGSFGSSASSSNEPKTIGEMKKAEEKKRLDPEEAIILDWTHGKSRNLRALLCSLHDVVWEGSRWNKCGMHQLVTFSDVKKMYFKACLAVHPDKQTGTSNERLSKLIFTELNDAWSKFQEEKA